MPKVSIIVPVYGVEKYIERCACSLFEQTLDDLEFIFVDDSSPDDSIEKLQTLILKYPNRIPQVRIIRHDVNRGLPAARQTGISVASGDYIIHCDSDDWIDLDLCETLYLKASENSLDVVIYNYKTTDGSNILSVYSGGHSHDRDFCINAMMHQQMWWSLCNKMFKRSLYENEIVYPKDGMGEDMCLCLQLFFYCSKIDYVDKYYYYYSNSTSIIQNKSEENCLSKFLQINRNVDILIIFYEKVFLSERFNKGLNYLKYNAKFPLIPILGQKKYYKLWLNTYSGCEWGVFFDCYASIKERIRALLVIMRLYPLPRNKYQN